MNQGTEFGADIQHLCQYREILPVVTDPETLWPNSAAEEHGAWFKKAEVELIDFTFAELNRLVERAGIPISQRASERQFRLPSILLESDAIDPFTIVQDGNLERRRSEVVLMAATQGCAVAADSKVATAGDWRNSFQTQTEERRPRMAWIWCMRIE